MELMDEKRFVRNGRLLYHKYRQFFLPTLLAGVATSMSIIIDSILVGNMLGPTEMAAVNLCMPVMQFFVTIAVWIGMGSSTLIATCFGKREHDTANQHFNIATWALLFAGVLITLAGTFFSREVAGALTDNGGLLPLVEDYLQTLLLGCLPILIVPASAYVIRTEGLVKLASAVLIFANVLNLLLDVVFMGPCQLGITGSSLATVVGYIGGLALLSTYFFHQHRSLKLSIGRETFQHWGSQLKEITQTGLPAAMGIGLVAVKLFFINHIVENTAGSDGLIVFSVCLSCLSFISIFISGAAGTMMPIVGTLLGERDFRGIHMVVRYTLRFSFIISAVVVGLFELFPGYIFTLFGVGGNDGLISIGETGLRIYSISLFGVSISFLMMYYFLTIRQSVLANSISVTEGLLFPVPLAWLGAQWVGLNGIWCAFILAELLTIGLIYLFITCQRKKQQRPQLSVLLIDEVAPEVRSEASWRLGEQDVRSFVTAFAHQQEAQGHPLAPGAKALLVTLLQQIQFQNQQRQVHFDLRYLETPEGHQLVLRDDGVAFNPATVLKAPEAPYTLEYGHTLSINQNRILY